MEEGIKYYKENAEKDYVNTPISVLRYISEIEESNAELLEALQEMQIDLNTLKTFAQTEKDDSRAEGMIETIQKRIDRNNQSIEKALK